MPGTNYFAKGYFSGLLTDGTNIYFNAFNKLSGHYGYQVALNGGAVADVEIDTSTGNSGTSSAVCQAYLDSTPYLYFLTNNAGYPTLSAYKPSTLTFEANDTGSAKTLGVGELGIGGIVADPATTQKLYYIDTNLNLWCFA